MDASNISDIIGLIMKNPEMLGMIKNLATASSDSKDDKAMPQEEPADVSSATEESTVPTVSEEISHDSDDSPKQRGARRRHLLCALKPYVSPSRARAIDSVLSFTELFEVIKRG